MLPKNLKNEQKERLLQFIDYKGLTRHAFCVKCGLSDAYFYSMRKGFGTAALNKILEAFPELNEDWLIMGKGEMLLSQKEQDVNNILPNANNSHRLPVFSLKNNGMFSEEPSSNVSLPEAQNGDICIIITDDAMSPKYVPSSLLQIREVQGWSSYLGYGYDFVFILKDGRRVLRRAEKSNDKDCILCSSYNSKYNEEQLPTGFIEKVYRVVACLSFY